MIISDVYRGFSISMAILVYKTLFGLLYNLDRNLVLFVSYLMNYVVGCLLCISISLSEH